MVRLNGKHIHNLGNPVYGKSANSHRLQKYFAHDLGVRIPESEVFSDVISKNENIKRLNALHQANGKTEYDFSGLYGRQIMEFYTKSNLKFEKLLNKVLPSHYLQLS